MKWGTLTAAAAVVAFGAAAPASALVIDTFVTPQSVNADPPEANEVLAPEALGGYREMTIDNLEGDVLSTFLRVDGGQLKFSNNAGTTGEAFIIYDGLGSAGLDGVNFNIGPNPFFLFDVVDTDIAGLFIEVSVRDTNGLFARYDETLPSVEDLENKLFFTQFITDAGFDFGSVDALEFYVRAEADSLDGILETITVQAVPVPAAAFLLVGAIGGLGALRLRRKS